MPSHYDVKLILPRRRREHFLGYLFVNMQDFIHFHFQEELLASGDPKYAHLKQPLHLQVHNEDDGGDVEEYEDSGDGYIDDFASISGCYMMTI